MANEFKIKNGGLVPYINYSLNSASGLANGTFNVAKTVLGAIHFNNGGGTSGNGYEAAITFQGTAANEAQAGIYVHNNGTTGTYLAIATTDNYANGPQIALTVSNAGVVNFPRATPTIGGTNIAKVDQTTYVGTTAIAINRASASQALTGITSIDGSAATLTTTRTLWGQNFNGSANVTGSLTSVGDITGSTTLGLYSTTTNAVTIDSGTTGAINIGTNANAKTITIGNTTGATSVVVNSGTTGITFNQVAAGIFKVQASSAPTTDMVQITNTGQAIVTAGVNALEVTFVGGAANVEAGAIRTGFTPGGTSGGIWNGYRIVPTAAAASGVTMNGFKFDNITAGAGTDNMIYAGTGWDNIINYNGTSVISGTGMVNAASIPVLDLAAHLTDSSYKKIVRAATTADLAASTFATNVLTGYSNTQSLACTTTAANTSVTTTSTAGLKVGAVVSTATVQLAAGTSVASITSATVFVVNNRANIATTAASGTGTVATLTFAAQTYAPYAVGSTIVVSGVTPTGYNGTFTVTACTTTTVSYSNATTGAQTVAGTIAFTIAAGTSITTAFAQTIAALAIDGVTLAANDRVLVKDSKTLGGLIVADAAKYNGIYYVSATGSASVPWTLTRALDADASTDLDGAIVNVSLGTANYGKSYKTRFKGTDTLNTTEMYWGRLTDVFSGSLAPIPTTAVGVDIATDTETVMYKTGSIADYAVNSIGVKTLQAVGASTYTRASSLYIAGAPTASTNVTVTTPYALYIASGNSYLGAACTATSFNGITGLASVAPVANGTAAVGTSTLAARQDHVHPISTLTIGTGLSGTSYNGSAAVTIAVNYGTTATTACVGNDARLSDARTPTAHTHGNITNAGAIGSTANLPVITTTSGVLTTGTFGTAANTFCQGNDSRLSDTRNTTNSITFTTTGGAAAGTTFNGSAARTIDYSTVGAAAASHTHALTIGSTAMTTGSTYTTVAGLTLTGAALNGTLGATTASTVAATSISATGQITSTDTWDTANGGGNIYLNSATGNRIDFNVNGVAAPAFTTRSAGTKIVLYPLVGAANVDYALGIENNALWSSVPSSATYFKWYHGTTNTLTLASNRIQADWSNATSESRLAFQSSTANGGTGVYAVPNGTATNASFSAWNNSTTTNAGGIACGCSATEAYVSSTRLGTGTYLPLVLQTNGSTRVTVDTAGIATFTNEIRSNSNITAYHSSDKRLKENIKPIQSPLSKVKKIGGYTFDWTKEELEKRGGEDGYFVRKSDVGVIAQEVRKILPEVVAERENGMLAVKYEKMVPLLIECIKELNSKIEMLEKRINA